MYSFRVGSGKPGKKQVHARALRERDSLFFLAKIFQIYTEENSINAERYVKTGFIR